MATRVKIILCILSLVVYCELSRCQDIRLVNGTYGNHMGRVEVLLNDTWGTICNDGWNYNDARVACNVLGFRAVVCAIPEPSFPLLNEDAPVLMSNVQCRGRERSLANCSYDYNVSSCPQVGGEVICAQGGIVGKTVNVVQVNATTHSITISWTLPPLPEGIDLIRWRIQGFPGNDVYPRTSRINITTFSFTQEGLPLNTSFSVRVRTDVRYPFCRRSYLWGDFSDRVTVKTAESDTLQRPPLPLRLVPPYPNVDFMGRVEIMYNNSWGTVCDDRFGIQEAHVVCETLNFSRALCVVSQARFGPGSGPIWMDNVDCRPGDRALEDCIFNGWGINNCRHAHDVSVICQPRDFMEPVTGLRVVRSTIDGIVLTWNPFTFPPGLSLSRYRIRYGRATANSRQNLYVSSGENRATISRVTVNTVYVATVEVEYRFRYCNRILRNAVSSSVNATVREQSPSGPPTSVRVQALNSTAVEVEWNLPVISRRNGAIRGFKIFVQAEGSATPRVINVNDGSALEYVVTGLQPGTVYAFSVLAYTVADGPRSIRLSISTFSDDYVELITHFGPNSNGQDRVLRQVGQFRLDVHCGSGTNGVQLTWLYSNETEVSYTDTYFRQGNNAQGFAVLQIGNRRRITYCDAGVYVCKAVLATNDSQDIIQRRHFTLLVGNGPPSPGSPFPMETASTWVTIGWYELSCNGGHAITEIIVRYRKEEADYIVPTYIYVYGLDPSLRNYTIHNLEPETAYRFSVQVLSAEFQASNFSEERGISTLRSAPSAPRDVTVRLVKTPTVEVRWRAPAIPNGIIVYYTIYAMASNVKINLGGNGLTTTTALNESSMQVDGHIGAVNMTVIGSHSYVQFQVSASIVVDGVENEGERSQVTSDSTVFVPTPNLPVPGNIRVSEFTNTSVKLVWNYPSQNFHVPILNFKVAYTARVSWSSPGGTLVEFDESKVLNISSSVTMATITDLFPATRYRFRVAAMTEFGQGEEVIVLQSTAPANGDKLNYFQMRISAVPNCFQWKLNSDEVVLSIHNSLIQALNDTLCRSCGVSVSTLQAENLHCDSSDRSQAILLGRIIGTKSLSSNDLMSVLSTWVLSDMAGVLVDGHSFLIDSSCPLFLDSPDSPDCSDLVLPVEITTTTATRQSSTTAAVESVSVEFIAKNKNEITGAEVGGLVIGVVIAVLLIVFIVLLVLLLVKAFCLNSSTVRMKKLTEEELASEICSKENEFKHENPLYGE